MRDYFITIRRFIKSNYPQTYPFTYDRNEYEKGCPQ